MVVIFRHSESQTATAGDKEHLQGLQAGFGHKKLLLEYAVTDVASYESVRTVENWTYPLKYGDGPKDLAALYSGDIATG